MRTGDFVVERKIVQLFSEPFANVIFLEKRRGCKVGNLRKGGTEKKMERKLTTFE